MSERALECLALLLHLAVSLLAMDVLAPGWHVALRRLLALGLWTSLASAGLLVRMLAATPGDGGARAVEIAAGGCAALLLVALAKRSSRRRLAAIPARGSAPLILVAAVLLALALALALFVVTSLGSPHGGWDAWITWNLRARQLASAEPGWRAGFAPLPGIHHPDYPLLLPGFIARLWLCTGTEWAAVPALVAMAFTFGTVAVAASTLARLRGPTRGAGAALALLGTPALIELGAGQYADVPLAFFVLCALAAAALALECQGTGAWAVAGAMAGCAAWTKNEGLVLPPALAAVAAAHALRAHGAIAAARTLGIFAAGLAPVAVPVVLFKVLVAAENDLVSPSRVDVIVRNLADPSRYLAVFTEVLGRVVGVGAVVPLLLAALVLVSRTRRASGNDRAPRPGGVPGPSGAPVVMLTLAALLGAYGLSYVITPHDLRWHLDTSLDRLLLQLWPGAAFALLLALRPVSTRRSQDASLPAEHHQLIG